MRSEVFVPFAHARTLRDNHSNDRSRLTRCIFLFIATGETKQIYPTVRLFLTFHLFFFCSISSSRYFILNYYLYTTYMCILLLLCYGMPMKSNVSNIHIYSSYIHTQQTSNRGGDEMVALSRKIKIKKKKKKNDVRRQRRNGRSLLHAHITFTYHLYMYMCMCVYTTHITTLSKEETKVLLKVGFFSQEFIS